MQDTEATGQSLRNAALLYQLDEPDFRERAMAGLQHSAVTVITDNPRFCAAVTADRIPFSELGLDLSPVDAQAVIDAIRNVLTGSNRPTRLVVDMTWAQAHVAGPQSIEGWARIAEGLASDEDLSVVSVYARERLIEIHMLAAFQAHPQFLAPSGVYTNPHWLPSDLARRSTMDEQLAFLLGRVVPDYSGARFFTQDDRMWARGATPDWIVPGGPIGSLGTTGARWHIHCFGQLRVYLDGQHRLDWRVPGSSPRKTKTLFAYLLQSGEKGAEADELSELLWPDDSNENQKRARLHHTIAMLRKILGGKENVLRAGEYYSLNIPPGSWIDITSFEQLCRRGLSLAKSGRTDAALEQYRVAEKLYAGDLFADLPAEYVHAETSDWILPKRTWLRDMAIKLHRDMSILLRSEGRLREAQEHCAKALALDPTSEDANAETLRVLHAQGRYDAMARQYRQYRTAIADFDGTADFQEIQALFRALATTNPDPHPSALD